MNKFSLWCFYIFTFGIAYFVLRSKAKKHANKVNDQLTLTSSIPIDINKYIEYLGGKDNIKSSNATISSIKVNVNDVTIIKIDEIKKMGAKGVMLSDGCVTCMFGDFSKELSKELNNLLQSK